VGSSGEQGGFTLSTNQESHRGQWPKGPLTLAVAHYDRHLPLIEGEISIPGGELRVLVVGQNEECRDGSHRHSRMLNDEEFDVAEVSFSSYLMARDRGAPFVAIPVFPRRLFSMSQMWVRKDSRIHTPADLIGKSVGLNSFQTTLSVLAKADLGRSYQVPWREIKWFTARDETRSFEPNPKLHLDRLPDGENLTGGLLSGFLDCVMVPHPPQLFLEDSRVRRLLDDPVAEESNYFNRHGYFPIMHVVAFHEEVLEKSPELASTLFAAFERSGEIARNHWNDPNWSFLAWSCHWFEHQQQLLALDIWPNGIKRNLENIRWFIDQSLDQGLISRSYDPSELFHLSTFET